MKEKFDHFREQDFKFNDCSQEEEWTILDTVYLLFRFIYGFNLFNSSIPVLFGKRDQNGRILLYGGEKFLERKDKAVSIEKDHSKITHWLFSTQHKW